MLCANLRTVLTLAPQCWPLFIFTTGALRSQKLMDSSKLAFQGAPRSHLTLPFPYAGIASTRHHTQVFFKYNIVFTLWEFHTCIKPISIIFISHTPHSKSSWMPPPTSSLLPIFMVSLLFISNLLRSISNGNIHIVQLAFKNEFWGLNPGPHVVR